MAQVMTVQGIPSADSRQNAQSAAQPVPSPAQPAAQSATASTAQSAAFSEAQKQYLDGFLRALSGAGSMGSAAATASPASSGSASTASAPASASAPYGGAEAIGYKAQQAWIAAGKRLSKEEQIKFESNPLDAWDAIARQSAADQLPEGADIFRFKFHGLFNVTPAQQGLMCRLRIPGGVLSTAQWRAIAECAQSYASGHADITTRANFQIREILPRHMESLLTDLHQSGIIPRGSGADNIRNVTGNPTAGIDSQEFIDVLPLCRKLHHAILHNREYYGLPRKFNIAFDGGSSISSLEDTNDIGFRAVKVIAGESMPEGVYFRCALGGITGHKDFARDTGLLLTPSEVVDVALAMVRVFIAKGDRGNRKKARLKYVLDAEGFEAFLAATEKELGTPLRRFPKDKCLFAPASDRKAHLGVKPQAQAGKFWVGVAVPAARLTSEQMQGIADLADRYGRRELRLTVWQNFIIPHVAEEDVLEVIEGVQRLGLTHEPDPVLAGLVACTGGEGCKFGQAATKGTALAIASALQGTLPEDAAVNIHLTGCPHSCAQHFIGDLGLLATKVDTSAGTVGGFHLFVGGGYQDESRIAVPLIEAVPESSVPDVLRAVLNAYLKLRKPGQTFTAFSAGHADAALQELLAPIAKAALAASTDAAAALETTAINRQTTATVAVTA
jgi:ferredoxin-nitrite reductase